MKQISNLVKFGDGAASRIGPFCVHHLVDSERLAGNFVILDHELEARRLGSPLHTHAHTVEISIVTEGQLAVQIGEDDHLATVGEIVVKPAAIPHAFWNPGPGIARWFELISPPGFDGYFKEISTAWGTDEGPDPSQIRDIIERFDIEIDMSSVPKLIAKHNLIEGPPSSLPKKS